jgi:hypothetical protein
VNEHRDCRTCKYNEYPPDCDICLDCAKLKKGGGVEMTRYEKAPASGAG